MLAFSHFFFQRFLRNIHTRLAHNKETTKAILGDKSHLRSVIKTDTEKKLEKSSPHARARACRGGIKIHANLSFSSTQPSIKSGGYPATCYYLRNVKIESRVAAMIRQSTQTRLIHKHRESREEFSSSKTRVNFDPARKTFFY